MEEEVSKALSANNINLMRYACNRLERIKRCGGKNILDEVAKGNPKAMEEALKRLLISNWEGPVVKFEDASLQKRLEECEFIHKRNRKKKHQGSRNNPFDIGRCKLSRINRKSNHKSNRGSQRIICPNKDVDMEADEILQMAEDMGLQLKKPKEEVVKEIKEQLRKAQI
ncbi:hypothetical protein ACET3Z_001496 [Daucus carota]